MRCCARNACACRMSGSGIVPATKPAMCSAPLHHDAVSDATPSMSQCGPHGSRGREPAERAVQSRAEKERGDETRLRKLFLKPESEHDEHDRKRPRHDARGAALEQCSDALCCRAAHRSGECVGEKTRRVILDGSHLHRARQRAAHHGAMHARGETGDERCEQGAVHGVGWASRPPCSASRGTHRA